MTRTFALTIAYDGTQYSGWQVQPEQETIQGTLQRAIKKATAMDVSVTGSGRTDAGVHALGQVASCRFPIWTAPAEALGKALADRKGYDVQTAQNSFDAGLIAHKQLPHAILLNLMSKDIDATQICRYIRSSEELSGCKVIAVAENLGEQDTVALLEKGFDSVLPNSADYELAVKTIEQVTAIIY